MHKRSNIFDIFFSTHHFFFLPKTFKNTIKNILAN